jgi:hypothetical protein
VKGRLEGGRGKSVRSMVPLHRAENSLITPEKILTISVFMAAPAGYHAESGTAFAVAMAIAGRWRRGLDNEPGRLAREKATAKTSNSLTIRTMNFSRIFRVFLPRHFSHHAPTGAPRRMYETPLESDRAVDTANFAAALLTFEFIP